MNSKNYIIIVAGEPNSIFLEIFFKSLNRIKTKKPIILIGSLKLVKLQMSKLKYKKKIKILSYSERNQMTYSNLVNSILKESNI